MHSIARLAFLAALCLAAQGTVAQDASDKRVAQAREAARRAQAALLQTQQERDHLRQQTVGMTADNEQLRRSLSRVEAQAQAARASQARSSESMVAAQAELARLREQLDAERSSRDQAEQAAAASREQLTQSLAAQRQVTAAVAGLLERSVQALGRAEQANRALHELGLQAVQAYTERTPEAMRSRSDPFLALGAVRLNNEAESLRKEMDAHRVAP